ncbi:hypothetical protein Tco_0493792 [Tanacetum coccineum]
MTYGRTARAATSEDRRAGQRRAKADELAGAARRQAVDDAARARGRARAPEAVFSCADGQRRRGARSSGGAAQGRALSEQQNATAEQNADCRNAERTKDTAERNLAVGAPAAVRSSRAAERAAGGPRGGERHPKWYSAALLINLGVLQTVIAIQTMATPPRLGGRDDVSVLNPKIRMENLVQLILLWALDSLA